MEVDSWIIRKCLCYLNLNRILMRWYISVIIICIQSLFKWQGSQMSIYLFRYGIILVELYLANIGISDLCRLFRLFVTFYSTLFRDFVWSLHETCSVVSWSGTCYYYARFRASAYKREEIATQARSTWGPPLSR